MRNNIVRGESSVKTHIFNGPKTMCNSRSLDKVGEKEFIVQYEMNVDYCCSKCASYLIRRGKIKYKPTHIEAELLNYFKENHCGDKPLMRNLMSDGEIKIAEKLVKQGLIVKGTSIESSKLKVYYYDGAYTG